MPASRLGMLCLAAAIAMTAAAHHPARAQAVHTYIDPIDQQPRDCYARPRTGGDLVLVRGRNDSSLRFWGYSTWDAAGQPQIILNMLALGQLPPIMTRFTFYHECAHLVLRSADEVQASCEGLTLMRAKGELAQGDELVIKREHQRLTFLGVKYLGNGKALWDATFECARARQVSAAAR
jgi:hypothetical protein